jgi:pimeloyl-ACP methyl ester carboxylesterase
MRDTKDLPETAALQPVRKGHIGLIVAGSVITGLIVASGLAVVVFGGAAEPVITGVVLLAFGLGWAMLALLSSRRTSQPQRWALVPAVLMGALGVAYLAFRPGTGTLEAFGWIWPIALLALVIWMIIQSRRSLRSWSRPVILYPLFAVLALAAAGGGYQTVRDTQDRSAHAMPGQLVDVGGYKLHINCTGSGAPAVVLEAGLGEPSSMMAGWIAPAVAASTKVCVYDRAGRGWSDPAAAPQDGLATAAALHTLLARAHVGGPYVLVGHSTGGVYMQIFAATYPGQVAGMVLLDSQPPTAFTSLPGYPGFYSTFQKASALFPSLARFGVLRLVYTSAVSGLPPQARAEERAFWSTASHYRSVRDEFLELPTALTQAQALKSLGGKPLVVVTAAKNAQTGWLPQQDKMATLSADSVHRVMQNATHTSLTEDKTGSRISSQAILDVVHAVRSGTPLTK